MSRATGIAAYAWPFDRLGDALEALTADAGLEPRALGDAGPPPRDRKALERWLDEAAAWIGIEIDELGLSHAELARWLRTSGPALVRIGAAVAALLVVLRGSRRRVELLAPDGSRVWVAIDDVLGEKVSALEASTRVEIARLLESAGVPHGRRARSVNALLGERLGTEPIDGVWSIALPPSADFLDQLRGIGLPRALGGLVLAYASSCALWILSWWTIGRGALEGRLDAGWLVAWALILLTLVPLGMLASWCQGLVALAAGGLIKRRLLAAALRLEPEEIRHRGVGQLLGQVIESEAVESLAISGGLVGILAGIEIFAAALVLAFGAGGVLHVLALFSWVALTLLVGLRYLGAREGWTGTRVGLTHDLVERLVGHRTRLAQESRSRWHAGEDEALDRLLARSRHLDRTGATLSLAIPTGWLAVGLAGLAPAFVRGTASVEELAIGLGGVFLAHQALSRLAGGARHVAGAIVAWRAIAPLFRAAARPQIVRPPRAAAAATAAAERAKGAAAADAAGPLVSASDVVFRYVDRGEPVLRGCSLRIDPGDRVLLEGPSGGGKSTLASIVAGLRQPGSGLVLLGGLDRATLGIPAWRSRIATAPQFHENHVLTGTLAFNLLMGRGWPAHVDDLAEADKVCRELGLGPLLDRMPAGLLQMVGETGWQLSHGERSRVYIARALLQRAELVVLDESFAALDPESLRRCMTCVLERAPTLLVIAHP